MADAGIEVVLVRHGRTAWNAEGRFLGRTDIPLDDTGRAQAEAWARDEGTRTAHAVYASPLSRALDTARSLGRPVSAVDDLREMEQGDLEGLDAPTAFARHSGFLAAWRDDPTGVCVPGGESLDQVRDRGLAALRAIVAAHRAGDRVLVVSHQMLIASVCTAIAQTPLARWRDYTVGHTGQRHLIVREDRWTLIETT